MYRIYVHINIHTVVSLPEDLLLNIFLHATDSNLSFSKTALLLLETLWLSCWLGWHSPLLRPGILLWHCAPVYYKYFFPDNPTLMTLLHLTMFCCSWFLLGLGHCSRVLMCCIREELPSPLSYAFVREVLLKGNPHPLLSPTLSYFTWPTDELGRRTELARLTVCLEKTRILGSSGE